MKTKGLTLIEAHKSGKKYRRPTWVPGYRRFELSTQFISVDNALATDYELELEAKLLTREDVRQILKERTKIYDPTIVVVLNALFGPEEDV
jgi:hypothetical protein